MKKHLNVHKYVVTDDPEDWVDGEYYSTWSEARGKAMRNSKCVLIVKFEFKGIGAIEDYRDAIFLQ